MLDVTRKGMDPDIYGAFIEQLDRFVRERLIPAEDRVEELGRVPDDILAEMRDMGLFGVTMPEEYGGAGMNVSQYIGFVQALAYAAPAFRSILSINVGMVNSAISNFGTEEQKREWLPKMVSGEVVTAIAMTEPGTGSDLQGIRTTAKKDGNHYVINGSKTYITNGQNADLILVCAKTDTEVEPAWKGVSIILVEATRDGFKRGRNLDKIGQDAADTSELFFEDVRVPMTNCLGAEGKGFIYLMSELPQERLAIAIGAQASAQRAFDDTIAFTKDRKAFGKTVFDFQNTRFTLADLKSKLQVGWAHIDWALARHLKRELTPEEGAAAKLWHTEMQWEVMDKCLQLHGGAGYMNEYPIARAWRGARVSRIYGGANEIMKELIGRKL